jgi:putative nucleotidyltransferase with HDIG domain
MVAVHQLAVYSDDPDESGPLVKQLGGVFDLSCHALDRVPAHGPDLYTVVDTSLKDPAHLIALKDWMARRPKDGKVIFVIDKTSRLEETRAFALGATGVVQRPLRKRDLLKSLWGDFALLAREADGFRAESPQRVVVAFDALENIFSTACLGGSLDPQSIHAAGDQVVSQIGDQGLADWITTVRKHHGQTYQHCLLVTGVAVAFGQHLGVGHADRLRLSSAGLLHDIGKARIPVTILEKPGPLDDTELAVMRNHPELGLEALLTVPELPPEMLDMVLHHHEYLDGSGYPHKLTGGQISDLVRIMTISDVFGALVERRSYKAPLSGEAAYQILQNMGPKLDQDLVRAFRPVSQMVRQN